MHLLAYFRLLAEYNRVANQRIYEACAGLEPAAYRKRRPGSFGSIHALLNHILLGDRIWLSRFEGKAMPSTNLDRILYEDFGELRAAREAEDRRIADFIEHMPASFLEGTFRYRNNQGRDMEDEARVLLAHLFNHQTHHRGQVHDQLSQIDVPPPSLDLHRVINP